MVVPATDRRSGSAADSAEFETYGEFVDFATNRRDAFAGGGARDVDAVDRTCIAFRRDVLSRIGALDSGSQNGSLDAALPGRIREAGLRVARADDVFVHRLRESPVTGAPPSATPSAPATSGNGHSGAGNGAVAERIEAEVRRHIPSGSKVLAVNHAEGVRLTLDTLEMWHLPHPDDLEPDQAPANEEEVIAGLEWFRERGAEYLVLPAMSRGWFDRFDGVRRHLERYPRRSDDPETVVIYELSGGGAAEHREADA
jgi:hypothetical protein